MGKSSKADLARSRAMMGNQNARRKCASCTGPITDRPKRGCKYPEIHKREQWRYIGRRTMEGHEYYAWRRGKERYYWLASDYRANTVRPARLPLWGGNRTSSWCNQCGNRVIMYPSYGVWVHTDPTPDPPHVAYPVGYYPPGMGDDPPNGM